ncbi:MAG: RNA methyltransferase [Bacteroidia bacterium]|nr:RNA methyltransferase [Bacteroidia bacterium]
MKNNEDLINHLSLFVTDHKLKLFSELIGYRTRYLTVVLEDIYQSQNASAVMRTCDCLGIQDIHIIENKNKYTFNPDVALGSVKWINMIRYNEMENNTLSAISHLRNSGYRIVATSPHNEGTELNDFDLNSGKTALFFGTELEGLSPIVLDNADEFMTVRMFGFTESFNISVSAAIILHHLTEKLHNSSIIWELNNEEKSDVLLAWLRNTVPRADIIEKEYFNI